MTSHGNDSFIFEKGVIYVSAKQKLIDLLNENLTHLTNHCKEINEESLVFLFKYIETFE